MLVSISNSHVSALLTSSLSPTSATGIQQAVVSITACCTERSDITCRSELFVTGFLTDWLHSNLFHGGDSFFKTVKNTIYDPPVFLLSRQHWCLPQTSWVQSKYLDHIYSKLIFYPPSPVDIMSLNWLRSFQIKFSYAFLARRRMIYDTNQRFVFHL